LEVRADEAEPKKHGRRGVPDRGAKPGKTA